MDIRLHYIVKGAGTPLVLLHGNGENLNYFSNQIAFFQEAYRVIAVDTRGHGQSPRGEGPFTLSRFADDLRDLLDGLGVSKAHVLGFSDGGNIALHFALKYPNSILKLIINGANRTPLGMKMRVLVPIWLRYACCTLLSPFIGSCRRKRELLALMACEPHIRKKELAHIEADTLVIAGENDMIRRRHTESIASSLKNGRLRIIGGDHYIAQNNSRAFNEEVGWFLSKSPGKIHKQR